MTIRLMGCMLVFVACAGCGFSMAADSQKEEQAVRQLLQALDRMASELRAAAPPLPQLCRTVGRNTRGTVGRAFLALSEQLTGPNSVSPGIGMLRAVRQAGDIPSVARDLLLRLGGSLGRYDLDSELKGVENLREEAQRQLHRLEEGKEGRLRGYRTLGVCGGAALAILLI